MIANIIDNKTIRLENLSTPEEVALWNEFSVSRPGAYVAAGQRDSWDGVHRFFNKAHKVINRPLLSFLRGVCDKRKLPLSVRDSREAWTYSAIPQDQINADFLLGITLDDHQVNAVRACATIECGLILLPTGGGKGEVICGICKAIRCPTVILAEQTVVVEQLKARLELRDVAEQVGVFYAGRRPSGEMVVVGSVNSLSMPSKAPVMPKRLQDEPDDVFKHRLKKWESACKGYKTRKRNVGTLLQYVKNAEMIIVDECDCSTSAVWKRLFRFHYNGRRRYGLSATPFDPDKPVENMILQSQLGSIIYEASRQQLESIGRIIPAKFKMLAVGLNGNPRDATAFDIAVKEHMIDDHEFHRLVAGLCQKKTTVNHGTLVLVNREDLGHNLLAAIRASGLRAEFIYGKTPKRRRSEVLRTFEKRDLDVIIGGKIINRGLDLRGGCESLVIAAEGKLRSGLMQKVGRALRINNQGESTIYGFLFRNNRYLYKHSRLQLRAMIDAGYDTTVVFPGGCIDGEELVNKQFRIPKHYFFRPAPAASLFPDSSID